jgi:MGT family glycosyltransferase
VSRFLFATMPLVEHTRPALPIARLLVQRGHSVRWYTGAAMAEAVTAVGATFVPMSDGDYSAVGLDEYFPERRNHTGLRKARFDMLHTFARPVRTQIGDLRRLLKTQPADVVVGDAGFIGGVVLQELGGPPFAAFGTSVLAFPTPDLAPFGLGLGPARGALGRARNRILDRVMRRAFFAPMTAEMNAIRIELGLAPNKRTVFEYQLLASLYLQFSAPGFEYPRRDLPGNVRFVGPPGPQVSPGWHEPPWWFGVRGGRRIVLVSQGTLATDMGQLIEPALAGLANQDVLVVAVTGREDAAEPAQVPDNAQVASFVPFERLMPYVDVFVTNGGYSAVQLALAHGVPVVTAGRTEENVEVSARVAHSGVGINLRTQKPTPDQLRDAVRRILNEPNFRERARSVQREIEELGREHAAIAQLEWLAARDLVSAEDRTYAA